jgi:hypothetical protein
MGQVKHRALDAAPIPLKAAPCSADRKRVRIAALYDAKRSGRNRVGRATGDALADAA